MFRKMRRFKQELNETECKKILKNEVRGVLSVSAMTAILTDFLLIIGMTKSKTAFIFTVPKKDINLMRLKNVTKYLFAHTTKDTEKTANGLSI